MFVQRTTQYEVVRREQGDSYNNNENEKVKNVHVAFYLFQRIYGTILLRTQRTAQKTHTEGREIVLWPNSKSGVQQSEH